MDSLVPLPDLRYIETDTDCIVTNGFDSHIAEMGKEYVLFYNGQVLPCYRISWG